MTDMGPGDPTSGIRGSKPKRDTRQVEDNSPEAVAARRARGRGDPRVISPGRSGVFTSNPGR